MGNRCLKTGYIKEKKSSGHWEQLEWSLQGRGEQDWKILQNQKTYGFDGLSKDWLLIWVTLGVNVEFEAEEGCDLTHKCEVGYTQK